MRGRWSRARPDPTGRLRPGSLDRGILAAAALLTLLLTLVGSATQPVVVGGAVLALVVLLLLMVRHPGYLPVGLAMVSMPLTRPSALGEVYAPVGLGLVVAAGIIAVAEDRRCGKLPLPKGAIVVIGFLGISYLWLALRTLVHSAELGGVLRSAVLALGYLAATLVVVRNPLRARLLVKGFTVLIVLVSASYGLTILVWASWGIGAGHLGSIELNGGELHAYFPATVTFATLNVGGLPVPRLNGFAREPGWMAMWSAFAFFLAPRVFRPRSARMSRTLLVLGVLGPISTAGFAVFVVVLATSLIFRRSPRDTLWSGFARVTVGLMAVVAAVWVAQHAPLLGVEAKTSLNEQSLEERNLVTMDGVRALLESPLFGVPTSARIAGVNLVAAIASAGLPYVAAITLSLGLPALMRRSREAATPLLVLLGTLAVAQPAQDSVLVFAAALSVTAAAELGVLGQRSPDSVVSSVDGRGQSLLRSGRQEPSPQE